MGELETIHSYYLENGYFCGCMAPQRIKITVSLIMFRFNLEGRNSGSFLCDIIARCSESGNGMGEFYTDFVNPVRSAAVIQKYYEEYIKRDNMEELTYLLRYRKIPPAMQSRMQESLRRIEKERGIFQGENFNVPNLEENVRLYTQKIRWMRKEKKYS